MICDPDETTRASYDRLAAEYTRRIAGELAGKPFDRDLLDAFAASTIKLGPVYDLGCGPGHVAAYLHERGVEVTGIDLSSAMVDQARALRPGLRFRQGSMTDLDERACLGGIVAFYSVIHIGRDRQTAMFARWRDALVPGGWLLVSFHVGERDRHLNDLWGIPVDVDFLFFTPEEIESRLVAAGLTVVERYERPPYAGIEADTRRCYLLARNDEGNDEATHPGS